MVSMAHIGKALLKSFFFMEIPSTGVVSPPAVPSWDKLGDRGEGASLGGPFRHIRSRPLQDEYDGDHLLVHRLGQGGDHGVIG